MRPQRRAGWFDSWARSEIRDLAALGLGAGVALVGCKSSGSGYDEHHRGGGQSVSNEQVLVWAPPEELASLKAAHPGGELPGEVCARLCGQEAQRNPEGGGVVGCFLRSVPVQNAPAPPRPEADPIDGLVVATEPPTEGAAELPAPSRAVQRV